MAMGPLPRLSLHLAALSGQRTWCFCLLPAVKSPPSIKQSLTLIGSEHFSGQCELKDAEGWEEGGKGPALHTVQIYYSSAKSASLCHGI